MRPNVYLKLILLSGFSLLVTTRVSAQVEPSAQGGATDVDDESMMTPPPVSGAPYADHSSSESRSNLFSANLAFNPAFVNNLLPSETTKPINAAEFSVLPSFSLNRSTPRQKEEISYSPAFTFYEPSPTNSLDSIDQGATLMFQYRFSPRLALSVQDNFVRTSNVFNESYPFGNAVSGSTQVSNAAVIAPYAEQLVNTTLGNVTYQFGRNGMVGGGGSYAKFDLPNSGHATGLYNSDNYGGTAFYSRRISRTQYFGVIYQYSHSSENPTSTPGTPLSGPVNVESHTISPFYTLYFNHAFSISLSAGIQHVGITGAVSSATGFWSPSGSASVGWQGRRGYVAGSYSRNISSGNGLLGAYTASTASGSGGWSLTRIWKASASVSYSNIQQASSVIGSGASQGDGYSGQVTLGRSLSDRFGIDFGYQYLRQNYTGVEAVALDPNSSRVFGNFRYTFSRPLGR